MRIILFIITYSITFFGCSLSEHDTVLTPLGTYVMGIEGDKYIRFSRGSYWVYDNVNQNKLDTIVVLDNRSEIIEYMKLDPPISYKKEYIELDWGGSLGNYKFRQVSPQCQIGYDTSNYYFICYSIAEMVPFFWYPFRSCSWDSARCLSSDRRDDPFVHDTYIVKGQPYHLVAEFVLEKVNYKGSYVEQKCYWARDVGLIKIEYRDLSTNQIVDAIEMVEYVLR